MANPSSCQQIGQFATLPILRKLPVNTSAAANVFSMLIVLLCVFGCKRGTSNPSDAETSQSNAWFNDVTDEWAIDFRHQTDEPGEYFMPDMIGSGAAIFDCDNDGLLDIYLMHNLAPSPEPSSSESDVSNTLYRQVSAGKFEAQQDTGLELTTRSMGVVAGDLNNDGHNDLIMTEYGRLRLMMNNGNTKFTDVTKSAKLANEKWGTSASFIDFDRDGWLDIVVANYVEYEVSQKCHDKSGAREFCGPSGFPPSIARLFRNLGVDSSRGAPNEIQFEDVSVSTGIAAVPGPGLGVVTADFDGDGWQDIFFADDAEANRLFINQRDGTFKDEALQRGIAFNAMGQTQADMGVAVGDIDGNGLLDVFVTHLNTEMHSMWLQEPHGYFRDAASSAGITKTKWRGTGFGTLFGDFDHDGLLDLAIANGAIKRGTGRSPVDGLGEFWIPYTERNQILRNAGSGKFEDRSEQEPLCADYAISRGLACADIDSDGALDLVVTNISGHVRLYRNAATSRGNWIIVKAIDSKRGGRDMIGAAVTIVAGDKKQTRLVNPSYSFLCSNDARCHFGVGSSDQIDSIYVIWPDGYRERFDGGKVNRVIVLNKMGGTPDTTNEQQ